MLVITILSDPEGSSPRLGRVCRDVAGEASTLLAFQKFPFYIFTLLCLPTHSKKYEKNNVIWH